MSSIRWAAVATLVIALQAASSVSAATPAAPSAEVTRVFLARHAERLETPGENDPPLTAAGCRRATALGRLLRTANVATVFATQFLRSRATAESVGVATGAPVEVVHSDSSAALARIVHTRFHGRTVVIVGHSDSLPNVVAELGWEGAEATKPWSYEDLGLLELRGDDPPQFVHLHYGGAADTTGMRGAAPAMTR